MWWLRRNHQSHNKPNAANKHRRSIRLDTTGWVRWSTGICAKNFNLTIWTNGTYTTQHLSERMTHKLLCDFDIQTDHLISARRPGIIVINKKKRTWKIGNFAVLANHSIKLKESEKKDKYLDLARELKKLWNTKQKIILVLLVQSPKDYWRDWSK